MYSLLLGLPQHLSFRTSDKSVVEVSRKQLLTFTTPTRAPRPHRYWPDPAALNLCVVINLLRYSSLGGHGTPFRLARPLPDDVAGSADFSRLLSFLV